MRRLPICRLRGQRVHHLLAARFGEEMTRHVGATVINLKQFDASIGSGRIRLKFRTCLVQGSQPQLRGYRKHASSGPLSTSICAHTFGPDLTHNLSEKPKFSWCDMLKVKKHDGPSVNSAAYHGTNLQKLTILKNSDLGKSWTLEMAPAG